MGRCENWRGVIDKPILELLTFGSNLILNDFGPFFMILGVYTQRPNSFLAQSSAAAQSGPGGDRARARARGLRRRMDNVFFSKRVFQAVRAQKGKNPSIFCDFLFGRFSKYLAPSGAKYREKGWAVASTGEG